MQVNTFPVFSRNYQPQKQQISFQKTHYTTYRIETFVKKIDNIFSLPIEQRSNHLIHEYNPINNKPIPSKFKFFANDGALVSVIRSVAKNQEPPMPYICITVEKDGNKKKIRLNPTNGRIIKSGIDKDSLLCQRVKHYTEEQINNSKNIKNILSYIPEIIKYTVLMPKQPLEPAKIQQHISEKEIDSMVEEAEKDSKLYNFEEETNKKSISPSTSFLAQNCTILLKRAKEKTDYYHIEQTDKIAKIIDINYDLKEYIDRLTTHMRHKTLAENFNEIFATFSGSHSFLLKNLKNNNTARVLYYPDGDMLRITIQDESGKNIRGHLIKDGEKLVKNFNYNHPSAIPHTIKIAKDADVTPEIKATLAEDISEIYEKMIEAKRILNRIQLVEPKFETKDEDNISLAF